MAMPDAKQMAEEAVTLFRANVLFRNFSIDSSADRTLIYSTFVIQECLVRIGRATQEGEIKTRRQMENSLTQTIAGRAALPGESGFPPVMMSTSGESGNPEELRGYLNELRREIVKILIDRVYEQDVPSKWWMAFQKRKFMNKPVMI